jgi:hypothetical protein
VTENGAAVNGLAISAPGTSASGATYVISYQSLLPPQVKAVVSATITGFPAATTTYTTPALSFTPRETFERQWVESPYLTIFVIVAVLALMAFALLARFQRPD